MRILLLTASALALSFATSGLAQGNRGGGGKVERAHGGGHGGHGAQGGGQRAERPDRGPGGGQRAERGNRGGGEDARRGGGERREVRQAERRVEREARGNGRGRDMAEGRNDDRSGGPERAERNERRGQERMAETDRGQDRPRQRLTQRRAGRVADANAVARLRYDGLELVRGCPPGLAKKNNGCMPPGLARQQGQAQQAQNWYSNWWAYPQAASLSYDDGYLYRLDQTGSVAGFIPLLGGALWPGNSWPDNFGAAPVPDYHLDYFGFDEGLDYRLADGAIYGVDPQNDAIRQIMALVTGDDWSVGQRMPDGYGVYNVPYQYRDQYFDTDESMYRYSDGYVYQVDPTTQLIQAAIQLIT